MLDIKSVLKKCKKELEKLNLNEKNEEQVVIELMYIGSIIINEFLQKTEYN
jgi:predicted HAD superfamily hydrolase